MNKINKLALQLTAVVTVATLCGPSAFAEDRHRNGTRDGEARATRQEGSSSRVERSRPTQQVQPQESRGTVTTERAAEYRSRDSRNSQQRNDSYNRGTRNDSYNRSNRDNGSYSRDNRSNGSYSRGGSYDRNRSYGRNDSYRGGYRGTPSYYHGRVSRYDRYNGGYRVWIVGAPYPFFIPEARFRLFPHFGVGIDIRLGGYYNSAGYYDYYDGPAGVYNTAGGLRGVVETVDYRRGTFVLRDEVSGSFVTAVMSGGDRRWNDLRPGDYVEVSGDWNRSGVFQAYSLDSIGDYRR